MIVPNAAAESHARVTPGRPTFATSFGDAFRRALHELRAMGLAGSWGFGAMPLFLSLVYVWFDEQYQPAFPLACGLLLAAGWLFALATGARAAVPESSGTGDRDSTARFESPRAVTTGRLAAGAVVLAITLAVCLGADMVAHIASRFAAPGRSLGPPATELGTIAILSAAMMAVSYALAFATAVVTRQRGISILLPTMLLATWAIVPLISNRFDFLLPAGLLEPTNASASPMWVFCAAIVGCVAMSVGAAVAASTRTRPIRVGFKSIVTAGAALGVIVFALARTETGVRLTMTDQHWLAPALDDWGRLRSSDWQFVHHGQTCFALSDESIENHSDDRTSWVATRLAATFRLGSDGAIHDYREAPIRFSTRPGHLVTGAGQVHPVDLCALKYLIDLNVAETGELTITGAWQEQAAAGLCRIRIAWPADGEPRVVSRELAILPRSSDGSRQRLIMFASTSRHACLVYATDPHPNDPAAIELPYSWPKTLRRFAWSSGTGLDLVCKQATEFAQDTPEYRATVNPSGNMGCDTFSEPLAWHTCLWRACRDLPQPSPPAVRVTGYARWHTAHDREREFLASIDRPGGSPSHEHLWPSVAWEPSGTVAYACDRLGLRTLREGNAHEWKVTGECPTPRLLRSLDNEQAVPPRPPTLVGDSILVQLSGNRLVLYDVADAAQPRRAGYLPLPPQMSSPQVLDMEGHLLVRSATLLVVLDTPG